MSNPWPTNGPREEVCGKTLVRKGLFPVVRCTVNGVPVAFTLMRADVTGQPLSALDGLAREAVIDAIEDITITLERL